LKYSVGCGYAGAPVGADHQINVRHTTYRAWGLDTGVPTAEALARLGLGELLEAPAATRRISRNQRFGAQAG